LEISHLEDKLGAVLDTQENHVAEIESKIKVNREHQEQFEEEIVEKLEKLNAISKSIQKWHRTTERDMKAQRLHEQECFKREIKDLNDI